ncbi:MAG: DUF167 domain-containing protein [Rhodospirillales bacterium]|nr:DUF167 domain-containing protein [Rhodospirillales bacterium]
MGHSVHDIQEVTCSNGAFSESTAALVLREPKAPAATPFDTSPTGVRVYLRVSPRAALSCCDRIVRDADGRPALRVAVTAPPDGGRANEAVVALLAKEWRVPRSSMTIAAGRTSRRKTLTVAGDPAALMALLNAWAAERLDKSRG